MSLRGSDGEAWTAYPPLYFIMNVTRRASGIETAPTASEMHSRWRMELSTSKLQAAIQWMNERRRADRHLAMPVLLDDATRRFDLDLTDQSQLRHLFHA